MSQECPERAGWTLLQALERKVKTLAEAQEEGGKETGVDWLEPVFLRASEVLMIRGTAPGRRCLQEGEPQEGEGLLQAK